jgi:hypothetical protein
VESENNAKHRYEFSDMNRKEKLKIVIGKTLALVMIGSGLYDLFQFQAVRHIALLDVSAVFCGTYMYINLLRVKTTIREFLEPPYEFEGHLLAYIGGVFCAASIYYQIANFNP